MELNIRAEKWNMAPKKFLIIANSYLHALCKEKLGNGKTLELLHHQQVVRQCAAFYVPQEGRDTLIFF